jgi:hypothetical protein
LEYLVGEQTAFVLLRLTIPAEERKLKQMAKKSAAKLPSNKEIDALTEFHSPSHECAALCQDLLDALEEVPGATGILRIRLLARIRALRARMRELKCRPCLPN